MKFENSAKFCKSKMLQNFAKQFKTSKIQLDKLVDFKKYCKTRIYFQRSMPIQPKTSEILQKFAKNWQLPYGLKSTNLSRWGRPRSERRHDFKFWHSLENCGLSWSWRSSDVGCSSFPTLRRICILRAASRATVASASDSFAMTLLTAYLTTASFVAEVNPGIDTCTVRCP